MFKPSIPQGTRDFPPDIVKKRQYIFNILRKTFELYGFQPLETPALENLTTLMGKYGEEGDRLIFKILNNGLHEKNDDSKLRLQDEWNKVTSKPYSSSFITERALRYDLTIPFARFVAMNHNNLVLPFRRYQMQPVWRADRPQKGRYREFWQCDVDVVGSTSHINEAELISIYTSAFSQLNIPVSIKINNRKLLSAIADLCDASDKITDITVALDKLDKIGWDGVASELQQRGINTQGIELIQKLILVEGNNKQKLDQYRSVFSGYGSAYVGIDELFHTLSYHNCLNNNAGSDNISVDISLARGLNYYTGIIMEVVSTHPQVKMGSLGGGGRYDNLTGLFGVPGISGVGISFGIDRIYDVLEELQAFPQDTQTGAQVLVLNTEDGNPQYVLSVIAALRKAGIPSEIYPDYLVRLDKQMKYADRRGFHYVIIAGSNEKELNVVSLKNLVTGEQKTYSLEECVEFLMKNIKGISNYVN